MKKLTFLTTAFVFILQGCSTIYFSHEDHSESTNYGEWHHIWLVGLIEGADAVDMNQRCKGAPWKTIKTERSFLQGFVAGATYSIYTPHGIEWSCIRTATVDTNTEVVPAKASTPR